MNGRLALAAPAGAALLALCGTACHRVTGVNGYASGLRHGQGYEVAAQVFAGAGLAAVVLGLCWLVAAAERRYHGHPAADYAYWGGALVAFGFLSWVVLLFTSFGILLCHSTC